MKGSSNTKILLRSSKYCFIWSMLAYLHCREDTENGHATRVSNFRRYFNELNNHVFDFSNGFRCSVVRIFEKLENLCRVIADAK